MMDPSSPKAQVSLQTSSVSLLQASIFDLVLTVTVFDLVRFLASHLSHMHLRGKAFSYEAHYPDGTKEMLLDVPQYDFNWQNTYELAEPKLLPKGTKLHCVAHFDNSAENLANPNPKRAVHWGDQTWDEMMIGYVDITPADTSLPIASTSYHSNRTVSTCRQVSVSKQKKVPSVLSKVLQMKDDDSVCYWRLPPPSVSFVAYVLA